MSSALLFYTVFYFLLSGCIAYPPTEFVTAGLTIKHILAGWLGSENESFVQYHIRRSVVTLFVHSMLPFGYVLGLILFGHMDAAKIILGTDNNQIWSSLLSCVVLIPLYTLHKILDWSTNNWSKHPIAKALAIYREDADGDGDDNDNDNDNDNATSSWVGVARDINTEYRRVDKIIIDTNSVTRVIATDNWIIKVTPYEMHVAHQRDAALIVNRADTHAMSPMTRGGEVQFINIEVRPTRTGARSFAIRLNALDFKDLQDKISRPIVVPRDITFHKTLLDLFIDAFKEQASRNPVYATIQEPDQCIGCMQAPSNVKLYKLCGGRGTSNRKCTTCFCRPMWCLDCMAKWFASRQDENAPETWLSSKCTCPVCRARFCLLDVCLTWSYP